MAKSTKDYWDKVEILGKLGTPVAIALLTIFVSQGISKIEQDLKQKDQTLESVQIFQEVYASDDGKLGVYFVSLIPDDQIRRELRNYIVWDKLEKRFGQGKEKAFESESEDWRTLGENLQFWFREDCRQANAYTKRIFEVSRERWKEDEPEIEKLRACK